MNLTTGILAWIATAAIVTTWQLTTRWGVTTSLTPVDLALFRYGVPGLLLAPLLWKRGMVAPGRPWGTTALIVFGGGLPFGLLGMAGAQFAPAAHMGALLPGSMPLFVAIASALMLGERYDRLRLSGLALIVLASFLVTAGGLFGHHDGATIVGDALFLAAGVSWALYTVAYRKSGLDPWHGAAIICGWSSVALVPLWLVLPETGLLTAPAHDIALQFFVQGVLAGLLGMFVFGVAVLRLGPAATALSGAVVPAATAVGGWLILDESISALSIAGTVVMVTGLIVFSLGRTHSRPQAFLASKAP